MDKVKSELVVSMPAFCYILYVLIIAYKNKKDNIMFPPR